MAVVKLTSAQIASLRCNRPHSGSHLLSGRSGDRNLECNGCGDTVHAEDANRVAHGPVTERTGNPVLHGSVVRIK